MKKLLLVIFLFFAGYSSAQITIGDYILLHYNDTLWITQDFNPSIELGTSGPDQYWDFTSLSSGIGNRNILSKTNSSIIASSIDYDFFIEEGNRTFKFYKTVNKEIYEVAVQKPHPLNPEVEVISQYTKPKLIRYSGMRYGDDKYLSSLIYYTLSNREIPNNIKTKLPVRADSLRMIEEEFQDFHVDAWGVLNLSYERFDVLKLDLTTFQTSAIEIYSAGKWSRIDKSMLDPSNQILDDIKERYFIFFSNNSKEPIAKVKVDNSEKAINAQFKASKIMGNLVNITEGQTELILSPNPSYGAVKLELVNTAFGNYKFEIFNVIGKKIWGDEINVDRQFSSFNYDFSFLGKGTYLWALTDKNGFRITTKRMVIITP